jgi:nitrite reductase/ring-hydroxylating ferredoxin subunit
MSGIGGIRANRRIVFQGLGALGVAVALAGCAGDDGGDEGGDEGGGNDVESGAELTTTDQVPVGGGIVLTDQKVVVTQPSKGEFKAYTAVCTHQQLLVTSVEDGVIHCDNHGSEYDAATGDVSRGPAPSALAAVAITVDGDRIVTA